MVISIIVLILLGLILCILLWFVYLYWKLRQKALQFRNKVRHTVNLAKKDPKSLTRKNVTPKK